MYVECMNIKRCTALLCISSSMVYVELSATHRYRPEIPEPAPSLSRHGAPMGGIQVFACDQNPVIRQLCMCCGLSVKINV